MKSEDLAFGDGPIIPLGDYSYHTTKIERVPGWRDEFCLQLAADVVGALARSGELSTSYKLGEWVAEIAMEIRDRYDWEGEEEDGG